jgi:hypothetical protein
MAAGLVTVGAAVVLATAPATGATAQPAEGPQPAIAAAPRPLALPSGERYSGKIGWWGQPTIWRPPARTHAALTAQSMAELTWAPAQAEPPWAVPQSPDADRTEIPARWPATAQPARDPHAGTFLWSEPAPIWRPPNRTDAI